MAARNSGDSASKPRWSVAAAKPSQPVWENVASTDDHHHQPRQHQQHQVRSGSDTSRPSSNMPAHHRRLMRMRSNEDSPGSSPGGSARAPRTGRAAAGHVVHQPGGDTPTPRPAAPRPTPTGHHPQQHVNEWDSLYPGGGAGGRSVTPPVRRSLEADLSAQDGHHETIPGGGYPHGSSGDNGEDHQRDEALVNDVSFCGALPNLVDVPAARPRSRCVSRGHRHLGGDGVAAAANDEFGLGEAPAALRACAAVPEQHIVWVGTSEGAIVARDSRTGDVVVADAPASSVKNGPINCMLTVPRADDGNANNTSAGRPEVAYEVWIACASKRLIIMCGETGEVVATSTMSGGGLCMALSVCKRFVLIGGVDGRVNGWCAQRCHQVFTIRGHRQALVALDTFPFSLHPRTGAPRPREFAADGASESLHFATGSDDGELLVWSSSPNPSIPYTVAAEVSDAHKGHGVLAICFVPEKCEVPRDQSGGGGGGGKPNRSPAAKPRSPRSPGGKTTTAAPVTCESSLWSGGADGTIRVWTTTKLDAVATLRGHDTAVTQIVNCPGECRVWTSSLDGTVLSWDPRTFAVLCSLDQGQPVLSVLPVARTYVWRLWVCADDGSGRVYLAASTNADVAPGRAAVTDASESAGPPSSSVVLPPKQPLPDSLREKRQQARESSAARKSSGEGRGQSSVDAAFEAVEEIARARATLEASERRNDALSNQVERLMEEVQQLRTATSFSTAQRLVEGSASPSGDALSQLGTPGARQSEVLAVTPDPGTGTGVQRPKWVSPRADQEPDALPEAPKSPASVEATTTTSSGGVTPANHHEWVAAHFDTLEDSARHNIEWGAHVAHQQLVRAFDETAPTSDELSASRRQVEYWRGLVKSQQAQTDDLRERVKQLEASAEEHEKTFESEIEARETTIDKLKDQITTLRNRFVHGGSSTAASSVAPLQSPVDSRAVSASVQPLLAGTTNNSAVASQAASAAASHTGSPNARAPPVTAGGTDAFPSGEAHPAATSTVSLAEHQQEVVRLRKAHADELAVLGAERARELEATRDSHSRAVNELQQKLDKATAAQGASSRDLQTRHEEQIRRLTTAVDEASRKLHDALRDRETLRGQVADAQAEHGRYRDDTQGTIDALRAEIAAQEKQLARAASSHEDLQQCLEEALSTKASKAPTPVSTPAPEGALSASGQVSAVASRAESPAAVTSEKPVVVIDVTKQLAKAEARIEVLEDELQRRNVQSDDLRATVREAQRTESEQQNEIAALQDALETLEREASDLREAKATEQREASGKIQQLQQDLLAMKGPWQSMKTALQESHEALEDARANFVSQVAELEDTLEERERELQLTRTQLERAELRGQRPGSDVLPPRGQAAGNSSGVQPAAQGSRKVSPVMPHQAYGGESYAGSNRGASDGSQAHHHQHQHQHQHQHGGGYGDLEDVEVAASISGVLRQPSQRSHQASSRSASGATTADSKRVSPVRRTPYGGTDGGHEPWHPNDDDSMAPPSRDLSPIRPTADGAAAYPSAPRPASSSLGAVHQRQQSPLLATIQSEYRGGGGDESYYGRGAPQTRVDPEQRRLHAALDRVIHSSSTQQPRAHNYSQQQQQFNRTRGDRW